MNTGTVSLRYAKALLKYVERTGGGEVVYRQVRALLQDPAGFTQEPAPELSRFVDLLKRKHRAACLKFILHSFVRLYDDRTGRKEAVLVTAVPAPEFAARVRELLSQVKDCRLEMEEKVDPALIGGFVLDIDGLRMDASVRSQLSRVLNSLNEQNRTRVV